MNFQFRNMTLTPRAVHRLGPSAALTPLRCGFQYVEKGHTDLNFITYEYAMVYILSGYGYYIDEVYGRLEVRPGNFVQRFPGVLHSLVLDGPRACFYLAVPGEAFELFRVTDALASECPVINVGLMDSIVNSFLEILNNLEQSREEDLMPVLIKAQEKMYRFHQLAQKLLKPTDAIMEKAIVSLSRNLNQKIALEEIALSLNMSYSSFRIRFKEYTGCAPGEFRIRKKIEKGRELLISGYNVKETAAQLGYPDSFTFSRQFKKETGISPNACRNLL